MSEFQNPKQEPGMERRLLLVFGLTFLVLIIFQPLLTKYLKNEPQQTQQQQQVQQQHAAAPTETAPPPSSVSIPPSRPPVAGSKQASAESETVIENDLYRIIFTNKGGMVKSWMLKKYKDEKGNPLELVNKIGADNYGYPLSLWTYDDTLKAKLNSALYVPSATGEVRAPGEINFEFVDGDIVVRKSFKFDHSYVVNVETSVLRNGQYVKAYPAWPAGFGDQAVYSSFVATKIEWQPGDKVQRREAKKVSGGATERTPFYWAGAVDQYFAAVFLPDDPSGATMVTLHNEIEIPKDPTKPDSKEMVKVPVLGAAVGDAFNATRERLFVGPKAVDVIESVKATPFKGQISAPDLGGLVDFGFFSIVAKPLFLWLKWTQQHMTPNWGWAIVVLTVIINIALLPLRITSMKSALKMQRIQPLVNNIKKKYEKYGMRDPRRAEMNQEISALFKEHHVNPTGGCLPLLIQMPFLWAFYTMLSVTIELRQAPWLWVRDLSSPDPYHVLPILIILSTMLMQKTTPNPGMDPAQQKMMNLMMPVMLGVFSWSVAAGLGVYWLLGTVIAIIQQLVMNKTELGREMRAEMEKRARKQKAKV